MRRFFSKLGFPQHLLHGASGVVHHRGSLACVVWAISGPLFNYSDTWQLVINTADRLVLNLP